MANVSRIILDHPALGTAGGAGLHASIQAIYKKLGDNMASRLFFAENLADTAVVDLEHNYGVGLADMRIDLYLWDTTTQVLTRITSATSPAISAFAVAEKVGFTKTKLTLTNNSGAERDLVLCAFNDPINLGELVDVDLATTAPGDGDALVFDGPSSKFVPGSASGVGELNTIKFPSKATDWVASGAGVTVATTTTTNELPLNGIIKTGVKITGVSGTDYARLRFTMPASFLNRKHKIEWEQNALAGFATGDFTLELHTNSASNYSGSYTQKLLQNGTIIVNSDGKFTDYFDAADELYYELRIIRVTGTASFVLANVIVGPGIQPAGAVVEDLGSVAVVPDATAFGTITNNQWSGTRVGEFAFLKGSFVAGTTTANDSLLVLPWDIDLTEVVASKTILGLGTTQQSGLVLTAYIYYKSGDPTDTVRVTRGQSPGVIDDIPAASLIDSSRLMAISELTVKVASWTGTLSTGANDIEYLYNTDPWGDNSNLVDFGYGPQGAAITNTSLASTRTRRVRASRPIQVTDEVSLEVYVEGAWKQAFGSRIDASGYAFSPFRFGSAANDTNTIGIGLQVVAGSSTDIDVMFGRYFTSFAGDANLISWATGISGDVRWRVKLTKSGVAVGFGAATSMAAGLAPGGTFSGEVGVVDLQPTVTPSNPASSSDVKMYTKSNKVIFAYNDAGTVRYKYLDMTGTGVTWVHTTTAP